VWLILALAVTGVIFTYGPHLAHCTDDGFITYRYARNLAEGHGLVFNPGERHLGTTAPGLAVLLGILASVSSTTVIPVLSGALALMALMGALALLARRLRPDSWLLTFAAALGLSCNRWLVEVLGHEGFVVALLVLIALECIDLHRPWASGVVWGLAVFIRPDSAAMGAVAGIETWRRSRRFPLALLVAVIVTTAVAALLLVWIAGSAIPFSLQVKRAEAAAPALAVGAPYWQAFGAWCQRTLGLGGLTLLGLALWGWGRAAVRHDIRALAYLSPALAMVVFYPLVGVPFAPWYLVIPLLAIVVGAASAVTKLLERGNLVSMVAALTLVAASVAPTAVWSTRLGFRPPDPRFVPMVEAAGWVDDSALAEGSIAAIEVGFLGFATRRPVLDVMGLGSPGALEALTSSGLPDFFLERDPAFLVANPTFSYILEPLLTDSRFRSRYEPVFSVPPTQRYPKAIALWERVEDSSGRMK
jgi:hypothetical protein